MHHHLIAPHAGSAAADQMRMPLTNASCGKHLLPCLPHILHHNSRQLDLVLQTYQAH